MFSSQPITGTKASIFFMTNTWWPWKKPATAACGKSTEIKETIHVCIHLSAILCLALSGVMLQELHITSVLCKHSDIAAEAKKQKALCCTECSISVSKSPEIPREQKLYCVHLSKLNPLSQMFWKYYNSAYLRQTGGGGTDLCRYHIPYHSK